MAFGTKTPAANQTTTSNSPAKAPSKPAAAPAGKKGGRSIRLVLPPAIGSYVHLLQPKQINGKGDPKYSVSLLWDEKEVKEKGILNPLREAIKSVATEKFGPKAVEMLKTGRLRNPLHRGDIDKPEDEVYAGKVYVNASSKSAPQVVDRSLTPIIDEDKCYSGCTMRVSVGVFAYENEGKGVGLYLNNVQVVTCGPRIDNRVSAESEFQEYAEAPAAGGSAEAAPAEDDITPDAQVDDIL